MKIVKKSSRGIDYLLGVIKEKARTITRIAFWKILHKSGKEDINLKIGRYNKRDVDADSLECDNPKSELTLDSEEFDNLLGFIANNYEPFKAGIRKYIPLDESFDRESIEHIKAIFNNPDKQEVIDFIAKNDVLPEDIVSALQYQTRVAAIKHFEEMIDSDLVESEWQDWFQENDWVLGSEFVKFLDERAIDTENITDYLMQAYDGFVDIIEIKRPEGNLKFWANTQDHGNYIPSQDLVKAITQATCYIHEVEREANSLKFFEKVGDIKTIKPRCILIFGRSNDWNNDQKEACRLLNSSYHNLTIMTYDHVLLRAKRIISIDNDTHTVGVV